MAKKRRNNRIAEKYSSDAINHIYQRAVDFGVLFYTVEDRLVYYSTVAVYKRKYGIIICASSVMFTHVHHSALCSSYRNLYKFLQDTDSTFARAYNVEHGREGRLFRKPPGISQKHSFKDKKTNIIYVYNNHVEKKLCTNALDERWSLLAYMLSSHPFSEPIEKPSKALLMAMKLVDRRVTAGQPLKYKDLHRVFSRVDVREKEQYIDYVIAKYALVDYDYAVNYFKDQESMMVAVDSTQGGEWSIKEDYYNAPDTPFPELIDWFQKRTGRHSPYNLSEAERRLLSREALWQTSAKESHLWRFFHLSQPPK